jgi:hypothetical protein
LSSTERCASRELNKLPSALSPASGRSSASTEQCSTSAECSGASADKKNTLAMPVNCTVPPKVSGVAIASRCSRSSSPSWRQSPLDMPGACTGKKKTALPSASRVTQRCVATDNRSLRALVPWFERRVVSHI